MTSLLTVAVLVCVAMGVWWFSRAGAVKPDSGEPGVTEIIPTEGEAILRALDSLEERADELSVTESIARPMSWSEWEGVQFGHVPMYPSIGGRSGDEPVWVVMVRSDSTILGSDVMPLPKSYDYSLLATPLPPGQVTPTPENDSDENGITTVFYVYERISGKLVNSGIIAGSESLFGWDDVEAMPTSTPVS
jgi:hypothetical protein